MARSAFTKIVVVLTLLGITAGGTWKISYDQGHEEGYLLGTDFGYVSGHTIGWDLGHREGYNEGYDRGEDFGYVSGNIAGIYTGRQEGHATGYAEGRESGWNDGRDDGLVEGKLIGFDEGYDAGYDEGADIGYEEGVNFGYEEGVDIGYLEGVVDGAGHGYNLRDPTYREAMAFTSSDRTDLNKYIVDVYTCRYFTRDFIENAMDQGYQCHYVSIRYKEGAHAIVAFNTVDRGIIYIEPQSDKILTPKVGELFYSRDQYNEPSFDDTVVEIMMIP